MALSPVVFGEVRDGKLKADDPAALVEAFRCHEGKRVRFEVKRERKARTLNQNAYYHTVIVRKVAEAMNEEPEVAHDTLKAACNFEMIQVGRGKDAREVRKVLSTADLDTGEFEAYCERCRQFAKDSFTMYIPLPNEVVSV